MKHFAWILVLLSALGGSALAQGTPGSSLPLASPAPSDILIGVHGGTLGVGGATSKFTIGSLAAALTITPSSGGVGAYVPYATLAAPTNYVVGFGDSIIGVGGYATGTTCPSNSHMGTPTNGNGNV